MAQHEVDLSSKLILVTGATRGIGRAVAVAAAAAGAEIIITGRTIGALEEVDDEIKAAIQIAAEVARFSMLLYGNEFSHEELDKFLEKMTQAPKK